MQFGLETRIWGTQYFIGIEVARSKEGFVISQTKYSLDILEDCCVTACRPSNFPMEQNIKLKKNDVSPEVDVARDITSVGRLIYLTVTCTGITVAVNQLSQFQSNPRKSHLVAAHRVL